MVSANFKPTSNSTLYVSYLKGLEAGATAANRPGQPPASCFPPLEFAPV